MASSPGSWWDLSSGKATSNVLREGSWVQTQPPQRCLPASQSDAHAQGTRKSHQVFILVSSEGTESHTSQSGGKEVTNHQKVALHFKTG